MFADSDGAKRAVKVPASEDVVVDKPMGSGVDEFVKPLIPVGWDTVVTLQLAGVGVSIINSTPTELAFFTCKDISLHFGITTWERFVKVSISVSFLRVAFPPSNPAFVRVS